MKKSTLLSLLGAGAVCVLLLIALLFSLGKSTRTLTIRAFIDGSDVIKVSGSRLWLEHDSGTLPGRAMGTVIYVNGRAWTPTWSTNSASPNGISSEFGAVNPPFLPRSGQGIEVTRKVGRGVVSLEQFPSADNDQTLGVRVDDEEFGGADWYEFVISWNGRAKSSVPATKTFQKSSAESNSQPEISTTTK